MVLPPNAWRDAPSSKDWTEFDELWWANLPVEVRVGKDIEIQDQWLKEETQNACWQYMICHAVNAMNLHRGSTFKYEADRSREEFIDMFQWTPRYKNVDIRTQWSRLQDNLEFARKTGMIAWYYRVDGIDSIRRALAQWRTIATWSKQINWRETRKDPYISVGNSWSWHFFTKLRYRDLVNLLTWPNSYGTDAYDNGYFHTRYGDISLLYTRYALIPKEERHIVEQVKLKLMLARVVLIQSNWQPSEVERITYWKYIKYREYRGDWRV